MNSEQLPLIPKAGPSITLRPSRSRAVGVVCLWVAAFYLCGAGILWLSESPLNVGGLVASLVGVVLSFAFGVGLVPRELRYDAQGFCCQMSVQDTQTFRWDQLEAYGGARHAFMLNFPGTSRSGFPASVAPARSGRSSGASCAAAFRRRSVYSGSGRSR